MRADRSETIWQGLMTGFIGYATIALSVGLADVLQGRSFFFTVSLLGGWLFYGQYDPAKVLIWPGFVFAYNGLHFVVFMSFGLLAAWLTSLSDRGPLYWYGTLVVYLFVFVHLLAAVVFMTEPMRSAISMAQILIPSLLAVVAMSAYLLWRNPQLRRRMRDWGSNTDELAEEHGST